ncbi:hypothetical protein BC629DRAFT_478068 [Irpex lacteus]|nr:hypothetical protein BC629DRAFT_478068 [Irpex lacteus]
MPQERRPPGARKALRRPYPCLFHDCQQAFPSPKDRGRHMDKHFEGRFECLRCHKKYARLDALKRHSSEQFRPKSMPVDAGASAKPYNVAAVSCIGGFELREWVELSGSRWLKPEHVLELRLPDPTDPLYDTLSRLMLQAHRGTWPPMHTSTFTDVAPQMHIPTKPHRVDIRERTAPHDFAMGISASSCSLCTHNESEERACIHRPLRRRRRNGPCKPGRPPIRSSTAHGLATIRFP